MAAVVGDTAADHHQIRDGKQPRQHPHGIDHQHAIIGRERQMFAPAAQRQTRLPHQRHHLVEALGVARHHHHQQPLFHLPPRGEVGEQRRLFPRMAAGDQQDRPLLRRIDTLPECRGIHLGWRYRRLQVAAHHHLLLGDAKRRQPLAIETALRQEAGNRRQPAAPQPAGGVIPRKGAVGDPGVDSDHHHGSAAAGGQHPRPELGFGKQQRLRPQSADETDHQPGEIPGEVGEGDPRIRDRLRQQPQGVGEPGLGDHRQMDALSVGEQPPDQRHHRPHLAHRAGVQPDDPRPIRRWIQRELLPPLDRGDLRGQPFSGH